MRKTLTAMATMTFAISVAGAQASNAIRLQLLPGSEISFTGTSTLHGFACKTTQFDAQLSVDPQYATNLASLRQPIGAVSVTIPVRSLACGNTGLEGNMFKALKATENPTIAFRLDTYEVEAGSLTADALTVQAVGTLKVAGRERPVRLRVRGERQEDGAVRLRGERDLLMSDFGIKPPSMMLGAVKTGDRIVVKFNLLARPRSGDNVTAGRTGT